VPPLTPTQPWRDFHSLSPPSPPLGPRISPGISQKASPPFTFPMDGWRRSPHRRKGNTSRSTPWHTSPYPYKRALRHSPLSYTPPPPPGLNIPPLELMKKTCLALRARAMNKLLQDWVTDDPTPLYYDYPPSLSPHVTSTGYCLVSSIV